MTLEDAPADPVPPLRRSRRAAATAEIVTDTAVEIVPSAVTTTVAAPVTETAPQHALAWLDSGTVLSPTYAAAGIQSVAAAQPAEPDLLDDAPRRPAVGVATVLPILIMLFLVAGYAVTALVWPLAAVQPQIAAAQLQPRAAAAAAPDWPAKGSAAVGVEGIGEPLASGTKAVSMASITKIVTALLVLDEMPLAVGEPGPKFSMTYADHATYLNYLWNGQSALDVPTGRTLTEFQLLEGMLIGSANNYADRLAHELWPNDAVYATAAREWLADHGLTGITVVNPSGYESANKATPAALVALAEKALANPVIAGIVATPSVKLPGAGTVKNTNALLADAGVVGVKTGTLKTYSLLAAKDVTIGDTTVRLYASVLGQKSAAARFAAARDLFAQLEAELQPTPSITAGTVAGRVTTAWGETVDVMTASDATVVLWNGAAATPTTTLALDGKGDAGDVVGTLTVTGPVDEQTVDLTLADDVEGPSAWWRLTHPVELFGLGG